MGHLPAFDWNTLRPFIRHAPFNAAYDYLFSRGIDPDVEDPTVCHAHPPPPPVWPTLPAVAAYRDDVRSRIVAAAARLPRAALALAVEHDAMHVETLLYMAAQRRGGRVARDVGGGGGAPLPPAEAYTLAAAAEAAVAAAAARRSCGGGGGGDDERVEVVGVPAGRALLGRARPAELEPGRNFEADDTTRAPPSASATAAAAAEAFGWDNEFPVMGVAVAAFDMSALPVTVGAFAAFAAAGGYTTRRWWTDEDWRWVQVASVGAPASWVPVDAKGLAVEAALGNGSSNAGGDGDGGVAVGWAVRTVDGVVVPLVAAASWPVAVSLAEARAYAAWAGGRLPTEAEWHRAAFGTPTPATASGDAAGRNGGGPPPPYPWGAAPPTPGVHGNFGGSRRHPADVGTHPAGASALGVGDLIGDGWEWTSSVFAPFEGFQAHPACTFWFVLLVGGAGGGETGGWGALGGGGVGTRGRGRMECKGWQLACFVCARRRGGPFAGAFCVFVWCVTDVPFLLLRVRCACCGFSCVGVLAPAFFFLSPLRHPCVSCMAQTPPIRPTSLMASTTYSRAPRGPLTRPWCGRRSGTFTRPATRTYFQSSASSMTAPPPLGGAR